MFFLLSVPISKVKLLILATVIVLITRSDCSISQQNEHLGNDINRPADQFNRNAVVSNGPECAPIGM